MPPPADGPLRIAVLTYRGNPHCGGQGVYVRHLTRALADLGHHVEVLSGPPYPELDACVGLQRLPSLDLYRQPDPFRVPRLREFRDRIDVAEFALMCTAGFPEPLTFSLRTRRALAARPHDFDVVHDNHSLGSGLLGVQAPPPGGLGLPVVATVHHPVTVDRRLELAHAPDARRALALRRFYGFGRMQGRVA
ncbi:MAG: glycosyltransferase, partial [Actinomycetota bacterium]|nr:glycosyltransferase [Actinomycetota bacterium]